MEFVETMQQAHRMCMTYLGDCCRHCPLLQDENCTMDAFSEKSFDTQAVQKLENVIMDWAKEHPKPVYPSWAEGWKQLFPNTFIPPCPKRWFGDAYAPIFVCAEHNCDYCKTIPMHAEIAEKLGIKPIVKEWEQ